MKNKALVGMIVAAMVIAGAAVTAFAENGPGKNGCGYGTPPKSAEERAARKRLAGGEGAHGFCLCWKGTLSTTPRITAENL